jgi:hypothetical protein
MDSKKKNTHTYTGGGEGRGKDMSPALIEFLATRSSPQREKKKDL